MRQGRRISLSVEYQYPWLSQDGHLTIADDRCHLCHQWQLVRFSHILQRYHIQDMTLQPLRVWHLLHQPFPEHSYQGRGQEPLLLCITVFCSERPCYLYDGSMYLDAKEVFRLSGYRDSSLEGDDTIDVWHTCCSGEGIAIP